MSAHAFTDAEIERVVEALLAPIAHVADIFDEETNR